MERSEWPQEWQNWRCTVEHFYGGYCGARAFNVTHECSATFTSADSDSGRQLLAHGVRPFDAYERPVAYDVTVDCENGHSVYVRTESVRT